MSQKKCSRIESIDTVTDIGCIVFLCEIKNEKKKKENLILDTYVFQCFYWW
jgi:hypothetical protein